MKVHVSLGRDQDNVVMTVWDNGTSPVSPNIIEESVSLGLSLVRTLTRQLGGTVQVSQGNGVTFAVRLPVSVLKPKESAGHRVAA